MSCCLKTSAPVHPNALVSSVVSRGAPEVCRSTKSAWSAGTKLAAHFLKLHPVGLPGSIAAKAGGASGVSKYTMMNLGFALDPSGGRAMSGLTGPNIQQPMAIVLDGQVYSAPNLNSRIGDRGVISGNFATAEVDYLIRVLAAGALDARLSKEPISTSVLGPSIGADNLGKGLQAVLLAVIVVAILMTCYYFFAGLVAVVALVPFRLVIAGIFARSGSTNAA